MDRFFDISKTVTIDKDLANHLDGYFVSDVNTNHIVPTNNTHPPFLLAFKVRREFGHRVFVSVDGDKKHNFVTIISNSQDTKATVDTYVAKQLADMAAPRFSRVRIKLGLSAPILHKELKALLAEHCGEVRYLGLHSKSRHPDFGEAATAVVLVERTKRIPAKLVARFRSRQLVISITPHEDQAFIPAKSSASDSTSHRASAHSLAVDEQKKRNRQRETIPCQNFLRGKPSQNSSGDPTAPPQRVILCRAFGHGRCARGETCKFAHVPLTEPPEETLVPPGLVLVGPDTPARATVNPSDSAPEFASAGDSVRLARLEGSEGRLVPPGLESDVGSDTTAYPDSEPEHASAADSVRLAGHHEPHATSATSSNTRTTHSTVSPSVPAGSATEPPATTAQRRSKSTFYVTSPVAEEGEELSCDGDGCDVVFPSGAQVYVSELNTDFMLCSKCFKDLPVDSAAVCNTADRPSACTALSPAAAVAPVAASPHASACPVARFMQVECPWICGKGKPAAHFNCHLDVLSPDVNISELAGFVISSEVSFCTFCSRFFDNAPGAQHYRLHADVCQPLRENLSALSMADGNASAEQGMDCDVVTTRVPFSQNASGSLVCIDDCWFLPHDFGHYTTVAGVQDFSMCFWLSATADLDANFVFQQPTEQHQAEAAATKAVLAPRADALCSQQGRSSAYSQKGQLAEREVFLAHAEKRGPLLVVDLDAKHAELFRNPAHSDIPVRRVVRKRNHFCALAPEPPLALPGATGSAQT